MTQIMTLRDYQKQTQTNLRNNYDAGLNRQLVRWFTGGGKGQPLSAKVVTPDGWRTIGSLSVGDDVIGRDGNARKVLGVFDLGSLDTYRVTFNDGTYLIVDGEHLWQCSSRDQRMNGTHRVVDTLSLRKLLKGSQTFTIPTVEPVQFKEIDLPLDPYLLGCLIGDGGFSGRNQSLIFSSADAEIIQRIEIRVPDIIFRHSSAYDYRVSSSKVKNGYYRINTTLRKLRLWGCTSHHKFIPDSYKKASHQQRLDLLRGLMDTDGTCAPNKAAAFCTVSYRLAQDVCELVRSLGGVTRIRKRKTSGGCGYAYRLTVNIPDNPFYLRRKAERYSPSSPTKRIVSVEPEGREEIRCISVEDELYVTEQYIVTHNTSACACELPVTFPELEKHGVLFISHRREILYHAYEKFATRYKGKRWCGIEMGELEATGLEDYIFVSVDSLGRLMSDRIGKYKRRQFGIIIVDEGHHVTKNGIWDNILSYFGVGSDRSTHYKIAKTNLRPLSVFLTATPVRADGQSLEPFLDAVAADYNIRYGTKHGWLTPIKAYRASPERGDIAEWPLEQQADFLAKTYLDYAKDLRTLCFARSVEQSEILAATINKYEWARAAHVDANTDKDERSLDVLNFGLPIGHPQAVDFMTNRLIFTEGYDNPMIQAILDNAPTSIQALAIQKMGRGLRPSAMAAVDKCGSAEERKEAIRTSDKPYLTYISTFAPEVGLDMPAILFGISDKVKLTGDLLLDEIVDLLDFEEEEMPEAPTRDEMGIYEIDVTLTRVDIWTLTVYNDEVRALSPLRWINEQEYVAIRLPCNPFSKVRAEQTPVIFHYNKKTHESKVIIEGGWVESMNRAVRAQVKPMKGSFTNDAAFIKAVDLMVKKADVDTYRQMQRHDDQPATDAQKKYLKTKKVPFRSDNLSSETAEILKDHARISGKLKSLKIK